MAVLAFYVRHMTMVVFCPRPFDVGCRAIRPPDRQWCTKGSMPLVHHVAPHTLPSRIGIDRCGPVGALSEVVLLIVCHIRHTQAGLQAFPAGVCESLMQFYRFVLALSLSRRLRRGGGASFAFRCTFAFVPWRWQRSSSVVRLSISGTRTRVFGGICRRYRYRRNGLRRGRERTVKTLDVVDVICARHSPRLLPRATKRSAPPCAPWATWATQGPGRGRARGAGRVTRGDRHAHGGGRERRPEAEPTVETP